MNSWSEFYSRTQHLPSPEKTSAFLDLLPPNARILDFGCGTGCWSTAFFRDRPDLTIDVLDIHLDQANLLPPGMPGKRFHMDFRDFTPEDYYDGIWARAALFFLSREELKSVFHTLANALAVNGIIEFCLVQDAAALPKRFTGMRREEIEAMLSDEALKTDRMILDENTPYGAEKVKIPTFLIRARKTT